MESRKRAAKARKTARTGKTKRGVPETGAVCKNWQGRLRVALVYPNTYHVGMSNLGLHTVYRLLNEMDQVVCERAFLPADDAMSPRGIVPRGINSLESGRPLNDFDIVAFSIAFENDFPNILTILDAAGFPLAAADRNISQPLVMAGGVACFLNPEPIATFIDFFALGEAEPLLKPLVRFFVDGLPLLDSADNGARLAFLAQLSRSLPGIYVPALYQPRYHTDGTLAAMEPVPNVPAAEAPERIVRAWIEDVDAHETCTAIVTPHTTFDATFLMEVSRGCPHGCRFCSAGYIYRPPRFRSLESLQKCMLKGLKQSVKIGLVGAAVSDLPHLEQLCNWAMNQQAGADESGSEARTSPRLSFSSLRVDALSTELIGALKAGGVKTATIAPDAGSQRLRDVINKGISEKQILEAAERLVASGIINIKLYFMVGLPTETTRDIDEIVGLCKRIKHVFLKVSRSRGQIGEITVSLSSFVPKPFTPLQWAAMDGTTDLKKKFKRIKAGLGKVPNVRVHADVPRWAYVQALLSRGDRRVANILLLAHKNRGNWAHTLKAAPENADFYVRRERSMDELFPWDFIDHGIRKSFLAQEYRRALAGKPSAGCPIDGRKAREEERCRVCGVCRKPTD